MCVAAPVVAMAATVLSVGMDAYSKNQQGKYQQGVAKYNQRLSEIQAADTLLRGREAADNHRKEVNRLAGTQRAAIAASGFDVGYGSAFETVQDTYTLGEEDAIKIEDNAEKTAQSHRQQASLDGLQGDNAYAAGVSGAGTSLLAGAGSVASKWYQYRR